jgi:hypothetical protein
MVRFFGGLIIGLVIGSAVGAFAAFISGDEGRLTGWVVIQEAEILCSEPYVWTATKEIECD